MDKKFIIMYISLLLVTITGLFLVMNKEMISDEIYHSGQIQYFLDNKFEVYPHLTVIPGYHMIMYAPAKILSLYTLDELRILNGLLLTLLMIPLIYALTNSIRKTLLYYFFPTLFSFYFLVYTDLMSMFFVILAYYLLIKNRPTESGIAILVAILIRQNNIVWLGMLMMYPILDLLQAVSWKTLYEEKTLAIKWYIKNHYMYIINCILFLAFVIINKGIIIYDRESHPLIPHLTNVYFILFISFFLFLPLIFYNYKKMLEALKKFWYWIAGTFVLIMLTFENSHWYNMLENVGFIKNGILQYAAHNLTGRALFAFICCIFLLWLFTVKMRNITHYIMYPFTVIVLMMSWLVDVRYYTVPFVLFMIFREEQNDKEEWMMLGYAILISIMMFIGVLRHSMFW
jgi:alpha-1,2-glucosyltransferase